MRTCSKGASITNGTQQAYRWMVTILYNPYYKHLNLKLPQSVNFVCKLDNNFQQDPCPIKDCVFTFVIAIEPGLIIIYYRTWYI